MAEITQSVSTKRLITESKVYSDISTPSYIVNDQELYQKLSTNPRR